MRCFILVPLDWPDSHALEHLCAGVEGQDCGGIHSRTVQQPQGQALHESKRWGFGGAIVNGTRDGWQGQDRVQANNVPILQLQHPWQECFGGLKNNRVKRRKGKKKDLLSSDTTKPAVTEKSRWHRHNKPQCPVHYVRKGVAEDLTVALPFSEILSRQSLCRNTTKVFPSTYISSTPRWRPWTEYVLCLRTCTG